jgi:hypothetical protein
MEQKPQVGTALIITKDDKVLLMKRKGPHGKGTWSTPGGHLDFGETLEGGAARARQCRGKRSGGDRLVCVGCPSAAFIPPSGKPGQRE